MSEDYCSGVVIASSPILGPTTFAWTYSAAAPAPASLGYGSYYWCVAVNRGPGTPATAALYPNILEMPLKGFKLNIVPAVPPVVAITYPGTAMSVKDLALTITWNMPATVLNSPLQFEVQIDDNALFNNREFEAITDTEFDISATSITTTLLNDGKYNLRVRAINSAGGVGPWSIMRPFTVDTIDPQTPTLLTPAKICQ